MNLKQYLQVLRERWTFIVLCLLVGLLVAGAYVLSQKPMYAAKTELFVSTSGDQAGNAQQAYQGSLFGQQRVKSYAAIVSSEPVVQRVKDELRLPDNVEVLQSEVNASAPIDTVLLDVTVTDRSAQRAQVIASSVGRQFSVRVNELETPQGAMLSPVKVSVAQPPPLPTSPVSPRKTLDLALGLLLGMAVGVGGAVLRETLDTRLRSEDVAVAIVEAPVLGGFRDDPSVQGKPLIVDEDAFSPRSEAFRQLRTNIRFLGVDRNLRSFVVTSSVAAEGKTTVAGNLAIALAQSGEQVVLVDADLRRPTLGELLGINPQVGLTNVLLETIHLDQALQQYRENLSLWVLASGPIPPNPSELLGSQRMQDVIQALTQRSTVVIFDTPPLLPVTDAAVLAAVTDGALLVARVGRIQRQQLRSSVEALRRVGAHVLGTVLNRLPAGRAGTGYSYGYSYSYRPHPPEGQIAGEGRAEGGVDNMANAKNSTSLPPLS